LTQLLRDALFSPVGWSEALYLPPSRRAFVLKSAVALERFGAMLSAPFAGVHVVEASKQVFRPVAVKARRSAMRFSPVLVPSAAGRAMPRCADGE
jgi:hypothetical protein